MMDDELCACGRGLHMLLTTCGSACACPLGCVRWETEVHGSTDMKGWAGGAARAAAISKRAAALMQRPSSSSHRARGVHRDHPWIDITARERPLAE